MQIQTLVNGVDLKERQPTENISKNIEDAVNLFKFKTMNDTYKFMEKFGSYKERALLVKRRNQRATS